MTLLPNDNQEVVSDGECTEQCQVFPTFLTEGVEVNVLQMEWATYEVMLERNS